MSANRSIKIRWSASHYVYDKDDGVRVRFDVVCANNMATKIFAYRMLPLNPATGSAVGHFSHVCSPPDLEEYPESEPSPAAAPEWFRLSYVDVLVRSVSEAADFIEAVRSDVRRLKHTLDTMDVMFAQGEEILGGDCDPPPEPSSSSASLSLSSISLGPVTTKAAVGTTEQSVGVGVAWESVGTGAGSDVGASDSLGQSYSTVDLTDGTTSQLLLVQGFDFSSIPDDAIIDGLATELVIRDPDAASASLSSMSAGDLTGLLLSFAAIQHPEFGLGDNKASNEKITGPTWQSLTHGSDSELWGLPALTGKDLKRGAFGLSLAVSLVDVANATAQVDGVVLTAYYREVV